MCQQRLAFLVVAEDRTQDHASGKADEQDAAAIIADVAIAVRRRTQVVVPIVHVAITVLPAERQPVATAPIAVELVVVASALEAAAIIVATIVVSIPTTAAVIVTVTVPIAAAIILMIVAAIVLRRRGTGKSADQGQRAQASHKNTFHDVRSSTIETKLVSR